MKITEQGWLQAEPGDPQVWLVPSERYYSLQTPKPLGIVWHTTDMLTSAMALAEHIRKRGDRAASWHVCIARDGKLYQSVSFLQGSWHAGVAADVAGQRFANVNRCTVGIEIENGGRLKRLSDGFYVWPFKQEKALKLADPARAERLGGAYWDKPTDEQKASAALLMSTLCKHYKMQPMDCTMLHSELDPKRREDPGPLWSKALEDAASKI